MKLSPSRKGRYLKKKLLTKKYADISIVNIIKAITSRIDMILIFILQIAEDKLTTKSLLTSKPSLLAQNTPHIFC